MFTAAQGGGWGYSNGSVEAVRFSVDQDIILGGYGLFGGRGSYNAEIKVSRPQAQVISSCLLTCIYPLQVFELGESPDPEDEGTLLASGEERGYRCDKTKTFRLLFEKPVLLKADWWYVAHVAVSSPSGASTDAGSSGMANITGPEK